MSQPAEELHWGEEPQDYILPSPDSIGYETPVIAMIDGAEVSYYHPGNFPNILNAHLATREDVGQSLELMQYKEFLTADPVGRMVADALDRAISQEPDIEALISRTLYNEPDPVKKEVLYARIVDLIAERLLPPGLDARVLREGEIFEDESEAEAA